MIWRSPCIVIFNFRTPASLLRAPALSRDPALRLELGRDADRNWPDSAVLERPPDLLQLPGIGFQTPVAELYRTSGLSR